jgi:hypothetical protein
VDDVIEYDYGSAVSPQGRGALGRRRDGDRFTGTTTVLLTDFGVPPIPVPQTSAPVSSEVRVDFETACTPSRPESVDTTAERLPDPVVDERRGAIRNTDRATPGYIL